MDYSARIHPVTVREMTVATMLKVAEYRGVEVREVDFRSSVRGLLHGDRIGIRSNMTYEDKRYTFAQNSYYWLWINNKSLCKAERRTHMIRIRVSYTTRQELERVKELLKPSMVSCKVAKSDNGPYKRAYIDLK